MNKIKPSDEDEIALAKECLRLAFDEFAKFNEDNSELEMAQRVISVFSKISDKKSEADIAFKESNNIEFAYHHIGIRSIVASALGLHLCDVDIDSNDFNPYLLIGEKIEAILNACKMMDAYSEFKYSMDLEQRGIENSSELIEAINRNDIKS